MAEEGFAIVPKFIIRMYGEKKVPARAFHTFAALLSFRNSNHSTVWPSIDTLRDLTGWSRTKVNEDLAELKRKGAISSPKKGVYTFPWLESAEVRTSSTDIRTSPDPEKVRASACKVRKSASGKCGSPHIEDTNKQTKEDTNFDRFWKAYPRKVGRGAAWRIWKKIRPSAELTTTILAAVEKQKSSTQWTKDGGQFIPHPVTWLNQERWTDVVEIEIEKKPKDYERDWGPGGA